MKYFILNVIKMINHNIIFLVIDVRYFIDTLTAKLDFFEHYVFLKQFQNFRFRINRHSRIHARTHAHIHINMFLTKTFKERVSRV